MTILTVDCPWSWGDNLQGSKGAAAHLHVKSTDDLCRTRLPVLDADSVCFLWRPASRLADALQVMAAWGFTPKTEIVWIKTTSKGNRHMGMGRIVRGEHETCLVGVRGKPQVASHSIRSTFTAQSVPYGKPQEFYDLVRELYLRQDWYDRTAKHWEAGWVHYASARGTTKTHAALS